MTHNAAGANTDPNLLTWPRWLGRAAAFGVVLGAAAAMYGLGRRHGGVDLSAGGIAAIAGVFTVGGFVAGLWEQIRPAGFYFWRRAVWTSWWVWLIELVVLGGLGYLVGINTSG